MAKWPQLSLKTLLSSYANCVEAGFRLNDYEAQ